VTSPHRDIAFASLRAWRRAPAKLTAVELARKLPSGRLSGAANPQPPSRKGREKDVARKTALSAPPPNGLADPPKTRPRAGIFRNGETRNRTEDTTIFSRVLYQLSYLAENAPLISCLMRLGGGPSYGATLSRGTGRRWGCSDIASTIPFGTASSHRRRERSSPARKIRPRPEASRSFAWVPAHASADIGWLGTRRPPWGRTVCPRSAPARRAHR
jgi:hypothetical protein